MDVSDLYQGVQPVDKDDLQLEIEKWELHTGQLPTNEEIEAMAKKLVAEAGSELDSPKHDSPTLFLTQKRDRRSSSLKRA